MGILFVRLFGLAVGLLAGISLAQADVQAISQVEVEEGDGFTRVILRGAEDPIYTAFMLSDPPRLLIDLPDVVFDGVETPIRVQNELVGNITIGAFGDPRVSPSMARVSIGLVSESEYEVIPSGSDVVVEIRPKLGGNAVTTAAPAKSRGAAAPARAVPTAKPAKTSADGSSRIVRVLATEHYVDVFSEGPLDNVDAFAVHTPERLVLDFWGVRNEESRRAISVEGSVVQKIRIGQHADKVRIVLDLHHELDEHSLEPLEHGVRIHLDGSPVVEASNASAGTTDKAAPAPAPSRREEKKSEPVPTDSAQAEPVLTQAPSREGPAWVESVHFESFSKVDRVVVSLDYAVEPVTVEPDPATIIIDLPGARIAPEAERRVDTREFGGPVQILSAFQTPDVDHDQVRIVLKRSLPVHPKLRWEGTQLYIEVEKPPMPGAPAATGHPPAGPFGPAPLGFEATPASFEPTASGAVQGPGLFAGPSEPASIDLLEEGGFIEDKDYQGRRISLDFKDADIGNILRLIADVSDLNIIAGEEVSGTVTIRLVDVPWDQALDVILLTKGLGFTRVGKVLRIAPADALKREEETRLQERRAREKLEDLVVKLQPVSYADVGEIRSLISKLLSERGTVNVDKRTNTLIIKDIPSVINEATALIKAIDTQTPQVLIEAKIVEASLTFSRSLGAVFGFGYNAQGATGTPWRGGAPDFRLGSGSNTQVPGFGTSTQRTNFIVSNPISAATGLLTMGLLGLNDHLQLDLQIQAAEANNKGKVISAPRVVTLDNREAKIQQGTAIRFDASDGDSVNTTFVDAVLELTVTPHITADRSIIMKIKVSKNSPATSESTGEVVGINKNETSTEALVFDGQTVVLGGIYVVDKSHQNSKVPFLADIPILGTVFKNSIRADTRRELLIFVTPRIVHGMKPSS